MQIIIDTSSMTPIYVQIVDFVKRYIASGVLKEGDILPSVRTLARELKISALTVKKAYDVLEEEGFTSTVHGKGTFVKARNTALIKEEQVRELEGDIERILEKAGRYGIEQDELRQIFELLAEE